MRVLIIKTSSLGDIIHGLQVTASLRAQVPNLHVSWVARDIFAPLVQVCEAVDQTYIFRRNDGFAGFRHVVKELRQSEFDVVLDMQGRLFSGLMAARCHAPRRIGRADCREGSGLFYTERTPPAPNGRRSHAVEILLQFCPTLGAEARLAGPLYFRGAGGGMNLSFADGERGEKPILVFPDSRREEKRWPGFTQLTEMLLRADVRRKIIWAGDRYVPFQDGFSAGRFLNLTGNTSLTSLPALIRKASWVISNDSGPMHLAAALGVKVLGIFGPTDATHYGPYPFTSPTNHFVRAPVGNLRLLGARDVYALLKKIDPVYFAK